MEDHRPLEAAADTPPVARVGPLYTVFTPTYQRAATLDRVYASLDRQTCRDFEWLIIDDGSTDGTTALVESWQAAASFPIRYHWQPNQGKHVAMNVGARLAAGELFLTIDSDDECVPNALERLKFHWDAIPPDLRSGFAAVTALGRDQYGQLVGTSFPRDVLDSNSIELVYRYHVRGDKWGFTRTDILREHPFPVEPGMPFVPEGVVWDAIGARYQTRYVNEVLLIIWRRKPPTLTDRSAAATRNARGLARWNRYILDHHLAWFWHDPVAFILAAVRAVRFGLLDHQDPRAQVGELGDRRARLLWWLALPAGTLAAGVDIARRQARRRTSASGRG